MPLDGKLSAPCPRNETGCVICRLDSGKFRNVFALVTLVVFASFTFSSFRMSDSTS